MCWLEPCAARSTTEQSRKECLGRAGSAGWPAEWGGLVLYNVNTETRSLQTNNKYLLSEYHVLEYLLLNCYCLHPLSDLPNPILNTDTELHLSQPITAHNSNNSSCFQPITAHNSSSSSCFQPIITIAADQSANQKAWSCQDTAVFNQ